MSTPKLINNGMRIKDLISEAPIADYETFGDFDKGSSYRRKADRNLIKNSVMIQRVRKTFDKVEHDLHFYFVNSPMANQHTEVGAVDLDFVKNNLDPELYERIKQDHDRNSDYGIFVIFTNNKGSEWKPMTPWMMAHRMAHALARYSMSHGRNRQFTGYEELVKGVDQATSELLHIGFGIDFEYNGNRVISDRNRRDKELMYRSFWQSHATFKSARDRNIRDYFEVYNEMFAQYMVTGAVTIKTEPQDFRVGRTTYTPKFDLSDDDRISFRQMAEMYSRDIGDYYIEGLLSEATGRILVM